MIKQVTHISLLVRDQEEALQWYTEKLEFEKRADLPFPGGEERWLTIAPKEQQDLEIVLQPPTWGTGGDTESRAQLIGKVPGWVVTTDDCRKAYETLAARGVKFLSPPEEVPWGVSAVFEDLYGTVHNLLEPRG
jgi:uncharacterized glyoxalase superfamily protein PhnB